MCVGALHWDVKARLTGQMIPGTSNPAVVSRTPGGVAGNIARTLARLGVPVSIVSVVGEDESGLGLVTRLAREGVNVDHVVTVSGAPTATYTAVLNGDGSLAVGVADMAIYERLDANVVDPVVKLYGTGALWCADANPATGGLASLAAVAELLMLDPVSVAKAPRLLPLLPGAAAIFPDAAEATALTGFVDTEEAATSLLRNGVERVVVTLGEQGVLIADPAGIVRRAPASHGPIADVTGAGDAMVAGYLAALARNEQDPVGWGLAAASLAVETLETVPLDLDVSRLLARLPR